MQRGSVNKVVIVGHMGADPETRFTPGGTAVANFSVATNERKKKADGEFEDHTEWHNCVLFAGRAEFAQNYIKKGQLVYLEGRLQTRSWEDDSGTKKYKTEIIGNEITPLGKLGDSFFEKKTKNSSEEEQKNEIVDETTFPSVDKEEKDDDLPF